MYGTLRLFFLVPLILARDTNLATVQNAFDTANIPTNVRLAFNPSILLEVTFPQTGGWPVTLKAGIQLPPKSTAGPPVFSIVNRRRDSDRDTFVVAAVDLDAPTPQNTSLSQIRHFLGGNFHSSRIRKTGKRTVRLRDANLLSNSTPALSDWVQPAPPAGSDPHRYVFLLFDQPAGFDENAPSLVNSTTSIISFNISTFVAVVGLGNPVGGTFMLVGPGPAA